MPKRKLKRPPPRKKRRRTGLYNVLSNTPFILSIYLKIFIALCLFQKSLFLFSFGFKSEQRRIFQLLLITSFTFALTQPQGSEISVFENFPLFMESQVWLFCYMLVLICTLSLSYLVIF